MGWSYHIQLVGGPHAGRVIKYDNIPKIIVFQGMFNGVFQIHEYERLQETCIYKYRGMLI